MKLIKLIILFFFMVISNIAFALTWDKKINPQIINNDGSKTGESKDEGFFGINFNFFPNCKKFNANFSGLRQGLKVYYNTDGTIHSSENGIFDCYRANNTIGFGLVEGITVSPGLTAIHFKREGLVRYVYFKTNNIWYLETAHIDFLYSKDPNSNSSYRIATLEEINHAERLYKFYKEIDLSSPKAKKYNVINTSINLNESKKNQDSAPAKKQNESGVAAELERLQKLFNSGAITKDEYQKAKNKVLK